MKKVLITGATGFLGGYVVEEFRKHGYHVVAVGRNEDKLQKLKQANTTVWRGDLSSLSELKETVDVVIHVAARSTVWGKWQDFYADNVLGTEQVINFCLGNNVKKLIFISSPSIYSRRGDKINIQEDDFDQNNRLNNYIRSKIMAEKLVSQAQSKNLNTVIIRPRGIIGVGDTSIVPRILKTNKRFGVPLFQEGKNKVDLTCVENVAVAIRLAAESSKANGNIYNITNGEPMALKQVLNALFAGINVTPKYRYCNVTVFYGLASIIETIYNLLRIDQEPPLTRYTICTFAYSQTLDISKAKRDLGYEPILSIREGIERYAKTYNATHT
jgi:nucleoside-diphosphate-sugar epimerase